MFSDRTYLRQFAPLTDEALRAKAPSVFADRPYHGVSGKYTFIPTSAVVAKLRSEGFVPVAAAESRSMSEEKKGYTKHVVRFRDSRVQVPARPELGSIYPEIVLTNGHDGASAYRIDAGLYRLICHNGLMVQDSTVGGISTRHTGQIDNIIEATYEVVGEFPLIMDRIEEFAGVRLTAPMQEAFAEAAIELRWDADEAPIQARQLVAPKRVQDADPTLWNTLNTVQEKLLYGGVRGLNSERQSRKVRTVTSVSENSRLNKALWTLAERMKEFATA